MDRFSLEGKTALWTGAERGIGLRLQRVWRGGREYYHRGSDGRRISSSEAAAARQGVSCTVLESDISKEEDVLRLAEQAWEIFPERT